MANQKNSSRLWILGASDPEMQAIESLLVHRGQQVAYATCGGKRCHPGNVYKADDVEYHEDTQVIAGWVPDEIVLVECDFAVPRDSEGRLHWRSAYANSKGGEEHTACPVLPGGLGCFDETPTIICRSAAEVVKVDHHRPGDPGYGRPPEEFLPASSIGQIMLRLACEYGADSGYRWDPVDEGWTLDRMGVTDEMILVAVADHCLESAYRGKCPGVDPDKLMEWRVKTRAEFQKRPVAEVLCDVENARRQLRLSWKTCWCCFDQNICSMNHMCQTCGSINDWADMRGQDVPELPEAAAREGIPFVAKVRDKDGREKVVLQAAPEDLVRRFLDGKIIEGLVDLYGDPARGFAGGYLKLNKDS